MRRASLIPYRVSPIVLLFFLGLAAEPPSVQAQRVLGIDVSAWQGDISDANWATLKRATNQHVGGIYGDGRDFVFIRSSRGGTTGYYNQSDPNNNNNQNTLSQRYDDPYFVQNITRATAAGLLAGSYHFARPDIIATTTNSGGIPNNGTDEANHMIEMAGAWMRPGYLLPVFDLEAGQSQRTRDQLGTFSIEFSDRIHAVMGIRPIMYINGSYSDYLQSAGNRAAVVNAYPILWVARYANQSDPNSIPVQTGHPKDTYAGFYGPWDDNGATHPWHYWQYASTARLNGYKSGTANIDVNVAQGGMEFLKDHLVPALWVTDLSGQWTTLTSWNSGQTPVPPVQGPGQVARVGPLTLPATRLPASNDTVILDRPNANITVTLASGSHSIRKLYVKESLNISGGSLSIHYIPSWDSTPISAQFSSPVSLSGGASLNVHTLQVDAANTFTLLGGTLTFDTIQLMPHSTAPAKILMSGDATFSSLSNNATARVVKGAGTGNSGLIDLGGAVRSFNISTGTDLFISVPLTNGAIAKTGSGTLRLAAANTYTSGTTLSSGTLIVENTSGSATGTGSVIVNGGALCGTGSISGPVSVNVGGTLAPGTVSTIGLLTLNSIPVLNGTNTMKINRNGGSPLSDKIALSTGTLTYGGRLVVSNVGAALAGGEVFSLFSAPAYSGAFSSTNLPSLSGGLNWSLRNLTNNGTIRVNRKPVASNVTTTNTPATVLKIPIASLTASATDADGDLLSLAGIDAVTTNGVTLGSDSTFIYYSNNLSVADQFNFSISDGHGGTATAAVQIVPSAVGRFSNVPSFTGNSVMLQLSGRPGWTYYVERSTNLPFWQTISTNIAPPNGAFNFTDDFQGANPRPPAAFYRLRSAP